MQTACSGPAADHDPDRKEIVCKYAEQARQERQAFLITAGIVKTDKKQKRIEELFYLLFGRWFFKMKENI